jgi:hypothetical protein
VEPFNTRCSEALQRLIAGILLFKVEKPNGISFPGYELYRLSCDFATGSAGIALFLHEYLTGSSNFLLDDLLMKGSAFKTTAVDSLQEHTSAPASTFRNI